MKVLIIPSWYPTTDNHLVGSFFKEQAELVQNEYDIKVLFGVKSEIGYKRFYYQQFLKTVGIKERPSEVRAKIITPPEAVSFPFLSVLEFNEKRNFNLLLNAYRKAFKQLISTGWKPDVIHAQSTVYGGIIACYLGRENEIKTVITEHQLFLLNNYSKFLQRKIFDALEGVNKVATVSYHQKRCILMHSINCDPIVVGNYIDENLFALEERMPETPFKILAVTYPSFIKDNDTFFKAIALMVNKGHTDIQVTVIGNNSFFDLTKANVDSFLSLAEKYRIVEYCNFIPYVERKDLPVQYYNHNVFVSTSIAETFGVAICEAMSTGMPVISTSSGGVDDTITDDSGIKVEIRDAEAIAEALISIKCGVTKFDPTLVRKTIVEKFGSIAFKKKLRMLYQEER
jgi:glycosyltransferase involved in cell wall biosynthesis